MFAFDLESQTRVKRPFGLACTGSVTDGVVDLGIITSNSFRSRVSGWISSTVVEWFPSYFEGVELDWSRRYLI